STGVTGDGITDGVLEGDFRLCAESDAGSRVAWGSREDQFCRHSDDVKGRANPGCKRSTCSSELDASLTGSIRVRHTGDRDGIGTGGDGSREDATENPRAGVHTERDVRVCRDIRRYATTVS